MITIGVCDDDISLLSLITQITKDYITEHKIVAELKIYNKSELLLYDIQENKHFDLLLLDIEMPKISGMDLVPKAKIYLPEILIIFVTSHMKYTLDAFELSVFRYVPKNLIERRFIPALADVLKLIILQSTDYFIIKTYNRIQKIPYKEISYVQRDGKNSVITLQNNETAKIRSTLTSTYKQLNSDDFIYIDRGCIINIAHVMGIQECDIYLKNGKKLPLSLSRVNDIKKHIANFWGEQI